MSGRQGDEDARCLCILFMPRAAACAAFGRTSIERLLASTTAHRPAMDEFQLPQSPDELWAPDCELAYRCEAFVDLAGSSADEVGEIAESEQLPPVFNC